MPRLYPLMLLSDFSEASDIGSPYGWRFWLGLIGFFALLGGGVWLFKYLAKRTLAGRSGSRLRVLEQLPITRDAYAALLQAGERVFLVGVTKAGINLIGEVDPIVPDAALSVPDADSSGTNRGKAEGSSRTPAPPFQFRRSAVNQWRPLSQQPGTLSFAESLRQANQSQTGASRTASDMIASDYHPVPDSESGVRLGNSHSGADANSIRGQLDGLDAVLDRISRRNDRYSDRDDRRNRRP